MVALLCSYYSFSCNIYLTDLIDGVGDNSTMAPTVVRGPYLQSGTPTSTIIKWRTTDSTDSKVWYGDSPSNLNQTETLGGNRVDHEVTVSGLTPNTTYYYAVGDSNGQGAGADSSHYFKTAPTIGTSQPITAWILGDCGTANLNQAAVRDAYYNYIGSNHTDMILMLGDNAYSDGFDFEYQNAVFDMYPDKLKNTLLWSCPGNHEYQGEMGLEADYFEIFSFPKNGEAGGLASNTERYYSFDYGNIHIVSLDSHEEDRSPGSPMLTWLENDLAATTQDWVVVIFHHPPYSKGSHDSDVQCQLVQMRENVVPICESYSVDLVLTGHSHAYERSKLIHGHYGSSYTYNPATHDVDGGNGRLNGDGAYQQNGSEEGTVYIVTGSAGLASPVSEHPIMYYSVSNLGSTVLEVDGPKMEVKFLNDGGAVEDYLTLVQPELPLANWDSPFNGEFFTDLNTITFQVNATDSDGSITQVEFFVDGVSIGTDTSAPYSMDWTPSAFDDYMLKAVATDNDSNTISSEISITMQDGSPINLSSQINNSKGDAEERLGDGRVNFWSKDLELIDENNQEQIIALRFNNINVPPASIVTDAHIQFTVDQVDTVATNIGIRCEDHDDAPSFATDNYGISTRTFTTDSVAWSPPPWTVIGEAGPDQQTPNLTLIVQEIIDRPGWESNNSMVFILGGTGDRTAKPFNLDPAAAPKLYISYGVGAGFTPPTVDWTQPTHGQYFVDLSPITFEANAADTDGSVDEVEFFVDGVSVGIDTSLPYSMNWTPPSFGNYLLKAVATDDDGYIDSTKVVIKVVDAVSANISNQINDGRDDVEEYGPTGKVNYWSLDLEMIDEDNWDQTVALRFNNINIPPNSLISNAYIQFTAESVDSVATNLVIHGEDHDNAPFIETNSYNITNRTTTSASANWSPPSWPTAGAAGVDQQTPDLSSIVQEVLDRPGWAANNSLCFIITGAGVRTAVPYNKTPAEAPTLHLTYYTPPCHPLVDEDVDGYCSDVDCDDNNASINPGASESCDGIDNDCDSQVDEGVSNTYYTDADSDSYGDPNSPFSSCISTCGYVSNDDDCNDNNSAIQPGATEVCDGIDNNCDGQIDEGVTNTYYADMDDDGFGNPNNSIQACNLLPGYLLDYTDCNDSDSTAYPGGTEVCDGVDNNCDGQIDEGVTNTYYADTDGDGFGDLNNTTQACSPPAGYLTDNTDCDDTAANIYIGADCDDGDPNTSNDQYNNNCVCVGAPHVSISVQIESNDDDAEQRIHNGYMSFSSSDLELVYDNTAHQTVGMRFNNIDVPPTATVTNAYIQFTVDETNSDTTNLTIKGEDHDDAPAFENIDYNISNRTVTSASASWNPVPWTTVGEAGANQQTPDLSAIVQEIIDRSGWAANNSMLFIITGSGERTAESHNGSATDAPTLHITYYDSLNPCDPYEDLDGDGYCSNTDCNDNDAAINPGATEVCDGIDNNCDGQVDEGVTNTYYADSDGDGHGDPNNSTAACSPPAGYVANDTDCDDMDASKYVGAVCDDGDPNTINDAYDSNCICIGTPSIVNLSIQINHNDDDVEERNSNGSLNFPSSDIELVRDNVVPQTVGLRFNNVDIPSTATVTNAYIQFTVDETDSDTTNLTIKGEDHDNAPAFLNSPYNVSNRTTTTASVNWEPTPWTIVGEAGADQQTPDLSAIVQEIIDRPGWSAHNSMVFVVAGSGERTAESHNGSPADAATLHITYSNGPSSCDPHVDADNDGHCSNVDCNDNDPAVHPGATEICDGIDNNCDGQVDEGVTNTYYADTDGDSFGDPNNTIADCSPPVGYVADSTDCDDMDASIYIGAPCDDGDPNTFNDMYDSTCVCVGISNVSISIQISQNDDDVEQRYTTGVMKFTSSDIELVVDRLAYQVVGLRFNNVNVPSSATIDSAYIQFTVDETDTVTTDITIRGEDHDNAPVFENIDFNISDRTRTSASANWMPPHWNTVGEAGPDQQTPDLSAIVQEIIDRPGWSANNSMVFIFNGSGERTAESHNASPADAATLHITYSDPSSSLVKTGNDGVFAKLGFNKTQKSYHNDEKEDANDTLKENSLQLFPNPVSGLLNVQYHSVEGQAAFLELLNQTGKRIEFKPVQTQKGKNEILMDMSGLPAGLYLIRMMESGQQVIGKVIVDH